MHVIATAGHVDHGKSTLVKALTGVDPDRFDDDDLVERGHSRKHSIRRKRCHV